MSLSRVIAPRDVGHYSATMASALLRLVAFVAVLLMPLGMASGPAAANPAPAASGHCDDHQQPMHEPAGPQMHCTACAALPASDTPTAVDPLLPQILTHTVIADAFAGIEPEIATPPPKFA